MRGFLGHIKSVVLALVCVLSMVSCIYDYYPDDEKIGGGVVDDDGLYLVLRISPLSITGTDIGNTHEKIKSLRIIVLSDGVLELNRYITDITTSASGFNYTFIHQTTAGEKEIYLIANEESVGNIVAENLSADLSTNLHDLLEKYKQDSEGDKNGVEFTNIINSVYFSSPYYEGSQQMSDIYLPYVSHYSNITVKENVKPSQIQMYLVPVATKFIFNFYNYRSSPVNVNKISMKSINKYNFLVPRVGKTDLKKAFGDTEYDWIDWLAKVSEASHDNMGFNENVDFNEKYGWISDYEMPEETLEATTFVEQKNSIPIPGGDEDSPSKVSFGPYYRPESKNLKNADGQEYYLTLSLEDTAKGEYAPELEDLLISNLKALFRNTCVIINVTMRDGDVEVYAEIQDWNHKKINGWVTEGQKP